MLPGTYLHFQAEGQWWKFYSWKKLPQSENWTVMATCFLRLYIQMETEGLLDIDNDLHMFVLRYVFEARIHAHLQVFTEGGTISHYPLRRTFLQSSCGCGVTMDFHHLQSNNNYNIGWHRMNPRHFNANRFTKICSEHFTSNDFINSQSVKGWFKADAVPLIFSWNK